MVVDTFSNPILLPKPPADWRAVAIEDLCSRVTSGGTPSRSNPAFYHDGVYSWFKTQELRDRVLFESEEKITAEALAKSSAKLLPKDTVLMAMYGDGTTITSVGILAKEATTNQACCAMIPDRNICDPRFLFYALVYHRDDFVRLATGGAQRNLSGKLIRQFAINTPPLLEQRKIGGILGMLDGKIELNQQMNKTLESAARVIFKHWFIDFEFPNGEDKPYKSSGGPMVLNEELGAEIPKRWRVSKIGQVLKVELGGTPDRTREEFWNGDINWINSGKVNEFRIIDPSERITKQGFQKSATKLLPKGTVVLAITGATLGQVSRLEIDSCANQSVIGILENEELPSEYLYFWIKKTIRDIVSWQTGAAQQHINKGNVENSTILIPPKEIMKKYGQISKHVFEKISVSCFESQNLANVRDSLLPKLMLGRVRVPVAAR